MSVFRFPFLSAPVLLFVTNCPSNSTAPLLFLLFFLAHGQVRLRALPCDPCPSWNWHCGCQLDQESDVHGWHSRLLHPVHGPHQYPWQLQQGGDGGSHADLWLPHSRLVVPFSLLHGSRTAVHRLLEGEQDQEGCHLWSPRIESSLAS